VQIDLNCDLGEGCAFDAELIPLITSANVACGFHAGDAHTARQTLALALQHRVQPGAHPGFADREHFGRQELQLTSEEIYEEFVYQVGAIIALARAVNWPIRHIKPHGALYNMACRDDAYARPIVAAAEFFGLPLLGLPRSRLELHSRHRCDFVAEGFADRRYRPDGSLVPRTEPDAFIETSQDAVRQVEWLIRERGVRTICVHGDNPKAVGFVRALRDGLTVAGHELKAFPS
jgi:5-oxoprolinase (ATP-hydrolysing) subunit A